MPLLLLLLLHPPNRKILSCPTFRFASPRQLPAHPPVPPHRLGLGRRLRHLLSPPTHSLPVLIPQRRPIHRQVLPTNRRSSPARTASGRRVPPAPVIVNPAPNATAPSARLSITTSPGRSESSAWTATTMLTPWPLGRSRRPPIMAAWTWRSRAYEYAYYYRSIVSTDERVGRANDAENTVIRASYLCMRTVHQASLS